MLKILFWGQKRIEKGAWFFAPLSFVWGFVSFWKNFLYDKKWILPIKVACPVVSVGNLVAGGTGKTPLVHFLASHFQDRRVAILSRGYGKIPDEPLLLSRRLKNAKIYVGKNRVKLAKKAVCEGANLIILDDGFQHRKLHRDFDLLVLRGEDPFGKGHYLPWGFLRDSPRRLNKADAIFITGASQVKNPHIELQVKVNRILDLHDRLVDSIAGMNVAIFCGIAKPHLFRKTVAEMGANIVLELFLPDHEKTYRLEIFAVEAKSKGAKCLICTEKDFVKLELKDLALPIYFVEISLEVRYGQTLFENLIAKIGETIDNPK